MPSSERVVRFFRKPISEKLAAIKASLRSFAVPNIDVVERRDLDRLTTSPHAPPRAIQAGERMYIAYRPDSDINFNQYPEIKALSEAWVSNNILNNAGDLPRLYALILNIRQVLSEGIPGDMAELGVYRGNSAAVLAHYARGSSRRLWLFDTFQGFDERDLIGKDDRERRIQFTGTSLDHVRGFVGDKDVNFVAGRFPESIPLELETGRFCLVHIDCDLYEPAKAGLAFFYPRLSPGGILIVHDYANPYWTGIKRAVDELCTGICERPLVFGDKSGTAMIRKSIAF